jgi:hypothetical protein
MPKSTPGRVFPILAGLLILITSCNGREGNQPAAIQPSKVPTAPIPAGRTLTSPPPAEVPATSPIATVLREDVMLYEGPFGHVVETTKADGSIRRQFENSILRENLPPGTELPVIGQYSDCAALNVILPDGSTGWVEQYKMPSPAPTLNPNLTVNFDCETIPEGIYRPWTGAFTRSWGVNDNSDMDQLFIESEIPYDQVFVLTDANENPRDVVYLRAGEKIELSLIGETFIFASIGQDWLVNSSRFRNTFGQFKTLEPISEYKEWIIGGGGSEQEHTEYTWTFTGTWVGSAPEGWVSVDQFPPIYAAAPFPPTAAP